MNRCASNDRIARLEIIKKSINADINSNKFPRPIPTTVRSFSELHDYVDANEYVIRAFNGKFPFTQKGYKEANELMDAIDEWLKNGRP